MAQPAALGRMRAIALHEQQSREDSCEVAALAGRALDSDPEARALIGRAFTDLISTETEDGSATSERTLGFYL